MNYYQIVAEGELGQVAQISGTTSAECHQAVLSAVVRTIELFGRTTAIPTHGLKLRPPARRGPKSREVYITYVEENSNFVSRLEIGDTFAASSELSTLLGVKYDAVGLKLRKLDKLFAVNPEVERVAELEGVHFRYTETFADTVKVD